MSEKLQKLINHERSARSLGNVHEADAFLLKIKELKAKQKNVRESQNYSGRWQCSCGMNFSLDIKGGGEFGKTVAEMTLAPHRTSGHELTKL